MPREQLTVLVPAYNEENNIAVAMNALSRQSLANDLVYKVIVLSNGCTDKTVPIAQDFINLCKGNVIWQVKDLEKPNKNEALNAGLSEADTDIIIYTDGDCRVNKSALGEIYYSLKQNDGLIVAGGLDIPDFSYIDKNSLLYQFQAVQQIRREERGRTMPVGRLLGFKKQFIDKFPVNIQSEDSWIALNIAQRYGWGAVRMLTDAKVYFAPSRNWVDFLRQQSRYEASFDQLLSFFPGFEDVYISRLSYYKQRPLEEVDNSILLRIATLGIDPLRFYQSRYLIDEIITENSNMMKDLLVKGNGTWEPIITTKKFKIDI